MGPYRIRLMALCLLTACSGTESSRPATTGDLTNGFEGYLFYPVVQFRQTTQTTRYTEKGRILAVMGDVGDAGCEPVSTVKYVTSADFAHPWILNYHPGLLEAYKFNVEWTDQGTLKAANRESTPDQGKTIANLASAAASAAKAAAFAPPSTRGPKAKPLRACNDGETLVQSERVPWEPSSR
jgi:hypothetical protein